MLVIIQRRLGLFPLVAETNYAVVLDDRKSDGYEELEVYPQISQITQIFKQIGLEIANGNIRAFFM